MGQTAEVKPPDAFFDSRLLSRKQVLAMLGISQTTLTRMLNNKRDAIPSIKLGASRKFQLDKVLWWIEKHEQ